MKWETVSLGDVLHSIIGGGTPSKSKSEYWNGDIFWCSVKDMEDDKHYLSYTKDTITKKGLENSSANLIKAGTVITSTRMGLGRAFINKVDMAINQDLKALIPNERIDNRFLLWTILSKRNELNMLGRGSTVKGITLDILKSIEISLPPLIVQRRIADILSAYDDLIDNNQKQIKLLEEAAMRLYKEWFVKLRFPGHENTKIVDGVPERWRQGQLREYIKVNPRSISKNYPYQEIQYIDIGSVNHGRIEKITTYRLSDAPGRAKRLACDGDTIWGMVRPNLKAYALVLSPGENYVFSTGFAILSPKNIPYTFLYCLVTQDSFVGYLINCTNGSAYPAVKPIHFEEAKVIIPDEGLLVKFHDIVNPMYRRIKVIENQNLYLEEARDRLLPKLMSGEIEV